MTLVPLVRNVAKNIIVRPAPNAGHYFNGLESLEDAITRQLPSFANASDRARSDFIEHVREELGVVRPDIKIPKWELEPLAA